MEDKIYTGIITRIVPNKCFGNITYIDHEETLSISFSTQSNPPGCKKWSWLYGDEVKFTIEHLRLTQDKHVARLLSILVILN